MCNFSLTKMRKTETTLPGADGSLIPLTMFCRLVRPKASIIRSDWTQLAF